MARTLAGVFMIVYGASALVVSWWAYSVTHEAFAGVRAFTAAFERERDGAAALLQRAESIVGRDNPSAGAPGAGTGAATGDGPAIGRAAEALRDRLRGASGGAPTPPAAPTPTPTDPNAASQPRDGPGLVGDLAGLIGQLGGGWGRLGDGPLPAQTLDRVELATNAVLLWLAAHGVASIVIGIVLLGRRASPAPAPVTYAASPYAPPAAYSSPDDTQTLRLEDLSRPPRRRQNPTHGQADSPRHPRA